jgi:hypothetical protein
MHPHHAKLMLQEATLIVAYLAFPLLEGVLRRACTAYLSMNGEVHLAFTVTKPDGTQKPYNLGSRCNNLRDLLLLHHAQVASAELRTFIDELRGHITRLDPAQDPFDLLYRWRNESLHGATNFQTIGGTILSFALVVSLYEIRDAYQTRRLAALEHARWEARCGTRSPWSFYPPV